MLVCRSLQDSAPSTHTTDKVASLSTALLSMQPPGLSVVSVAGSEAPTSRRCSRWTMPSECPEFDPASSPLQLGHCRPGGERRVSWSLPRVSQSVGALDCCGWGERFSFHMIAVSSCCCPRHRRSSRFELPLSPETLRELAASHDERTCR